MGLRSSGSPQQADAALEKAVGAGSFGHHDEAEYQDEYAEPAAGSDFAPASGPAAPSPDQTDELASVGLDELIAATGLTTRRVDATNDAVSLPTEIEAPADLEVGWVAPQDGRADPHRNPDGSLGGLVARTAHVDPSARVDAHAMVLDNARVFGDAVVADRAVVHGNARVLDGAHIGGRAEVGEAATVGRARVLGSARVLGTARIDGGATVQGQAQVRGEARVLGEVDVDGAATVDNRAFVTGGRLTGTVHVTEQAVVRGGFWTSGVVADGDRDLPSSARPLEPTASRIEVEVEAARPPAA